jgi:hypothetical protein
MKYLGILADSPLIETSYSQVGRMITNQFKDVDWYGLQYIGKPIKVDNINLISAFQLNWQSYLKNASYEHFIYIRNAWAAGSIDKEFLTELKKHCKDIIIYSPVEEAQLISVFFKGYKSLFDRMLTMTKWGVDVIKEYHSDIDVDYLYHYFDENKKFLGKHGDNTLNISYSQDFRKNLPFYFRLAHDYSDRKFIWFGKSTYYIIQGMVETYPSDNLTVIGTNSKSDFSMFQPDTYLANLYGISKTYVQTSYKEGFDLTVLEALVNGLNVVLPKDNLHVELFSQFPNAYFVDLNNDYSDFYYVGKSMKYDDMKEKYNEIKDKSARGYHLPEQFSKEYSNKRLLKYLEKR